MGNDVKNNKLNRSVAFVGVACFLVAAIFEIKFHQAYWVSAMYILMACFLFKKMISYHFKIKGNVR